VNAMKRRITTAFILAIFAALLVAQSSSRLVYATPKGEKYHLQSCRTLKKSKTVEAITIEEAKERGLEACKVCKPGE
jgi:hypothetical protein